MPQSIKCSQPGKKRRKNLLTNEMRTSVNWPKTESIPEGLCECKFSWQYCGDLWPHVHKPKGQVGGFFIPKVWQFSTWFLHSCHLALAVLQPQWLRGGYSFFPVNHTSLSLAHPPQSQRHGPLKHTLCTLTVKKKAFDGLSTAKSVSCSGKRGDSVSRPFLPRWTRGETNVVHHLAGGQPKCFIFKKNGGCHHESTWHAADF